MRHHRRSSGISAAAWFYGQPGFHAPFTPRERAEFQPSDPRPCIVVMYGPPTTFWCEVHSEYVQPVDGRQPETCERGRE